MNKSPPSKSKSQENQAVTNSAWGIGAAVILAALVLSGPLMRSTQDQNHIQSVAMAQSLGYQAWELEKRRLESLSASRSVANLETDVTGTLGQDAWGQAFQYKIRREGHQHIVDVWSDGPNGVKTQVVIPIVAL